VDLSLCQSPVEVIPTKVLAGIDNNIGIYSHDHRFASCLPRSAMASLIAITSLTFHEVNTELVTLKFAFHRRAWLHSRLSNTPPQPQVRAVRLDQEAVSLVERVDQQIAQICLSARMQVEFGLFEQDSPTRIASITLHQHR
jgi:hypothetical protein